VRVCFHLPAFFACLLALSGHNSDPRTHFALRWSLQVTPFWMGILIGGPSPRSCECSLYLFSLQRAAFGLTALLSQYRPLQVFSMQKGRLRSHVFSSFSYPPCFQTAPPFSLSPRVFAFLRGSESLRSLFSHIRINLPPEKRFWSLSPKNSVVNCVPLFLVPSLCCFFFFGSGPPLDGTEFFFFFYK